MATIALDLERPSQSVQVARSATVASIAIGIGRMTGLLREMVMANKFGAGFSYDAFLLAFRIPNLTRDLFAEGSLSSAFVPTFTATLAKEGAGEAALLANLVSTTIVLVVGFVCGLGMIFAPALVALLAPGFVAEPGKFELAVHLTRLMFPFLLLVALAVQAAGMLNSCGVFGLPALASTAFNIGAVVFGLGLGFWIGPHIGITPIDGMAYGILVGGLLQFAWQIPRLSRLGFSFRLAFRRSHPGLHRIFGLMLPALLANAAVQINVVVNTSFASRLSDPLRGHDGPVSWLGYALRFVQLPLGLFGAALASALLPSVARSAAIGNLEEFRTTVSRSLNLIFLLTIPSSVVLIVLGRPIIGLVFQSGRFQAYDTRQTALALACYSFGLLAYGSVKILNPAFYALSDSRTPMYASLLSIVANVCVPLVLLDRFHFSFAALALTTSFAVTLEAVLLLTRLRHKLAGIDGRYLFERFTRICGAAAAMTAALLFVIAVVPSSNLPGRWRYAFELATALPIGLIVFAASCRALHVNELDFGIAVFSDAVRRKIFAAHARIRS